VPDPQPLSQLKADSCGARGFVGSKRRLLALEAAACGTGTWDLSRSLWDGDTVLRGTSSPQQKWPLRAASGPSPGRRLQQTGAANPAVPFRGCILAPRASPRPDALHFWRGEPLHAPLQPPSAAARLAAPRGRYPPAPRNATNARAAVIASRNTLRVSRRGRERAATLAGRAPARILGASLNYRGRRQQGEVGGDGTGKQDLSDAGYPRGASNGCGPGGGRLRAFCSPLSPPITPLKREGGSARTP
jgi:hypothetical protein